LSGALLAIGSVVKAFGIRGDIVVSPMTNDARRFKTLKHVFIGRDEATASETQVLHVTLDHRGVRMQVASVTDRTSAENLVGAILFVKEKDAVRPPKGSFFIHDVIGLRVIDEKGKAVGILKDVLRLSPNDVYVVEKDGKEILLPAVKEFVKRIDIEGGTMSVQLIEGMIE
jgi:16S rRNA processing protein RimM